MARFLATNKAPVLNRRMEITAVDHDGREFPVELTVWAVDDGTTMVSFHAFVHDISERGRTRARCGIARPSTAFSLTSSLRLSRLLGSAAGSGTSPPTV